MTALKQGVKSLLMRLGYRLEGVRYTPRQLLEPERLRVLEFDDLVCRRMFDHGQELTFLQIGAYDGVATDPLHKYIARCGWRGVMVEPQPGPAAALQRLYAGNPGITVVEAAIDAQRGLRVLYTVELTDHPTWVGGMASFNRDHLLRHDYVVPGIADLIREIEVPCITMADVLEKLPSPALDLVQIDAEGADAFLLSLFPFDRVKPAIFQWEIKNLSRAEQEIALDLLGRNGYLVAPSGAFDEDALAARIDPAN